MSDPSTLLVLLAAGGGTRFVGPSHKLTAPLGERTVFGASLQAALDSGAGRVAVIVGAVELEVPDSVDLVRNPQWRTGQRSSILVAFDLAVERGVDAVVLGLADQPFVGASSWRAVAESRSPVAVATYDGHRAHPVRVHKTCWEPARSFLGEPDQGLRSFIGLHPELVEEVPCEGSPDDIDTVEDLRRWT